MKNSNINQMNNIRDSKSSGTMGNKYYQPHNIPLVNIRQIPFSEHSTYQDYSENLNKLRTQQKSRKGIREHHMQSSSLRASNDFYNDFDEHIRSSKSLGF
jgi:hypothetical protein